MIAMVFAVAALVIVLVAVIVVIERGTPAVATELPIVRTVAASDVVKLQGGVVTIGKDPKGLQVTDAELASKLGLSTSDTITAISGRAIGREFDVHEAIFNTSMMFATSLYIELVHDGAPTFVKWKLDGDLQAARHAVPGLAGTPSDDPPDPLMDTIQKIDDTHVELPHATVEALLADPMKMSKGARIVPAIRNGVPEGFKLYAIKPNSLIAKLGFNNGDTVATINGEDISSPDKALRLYSRVRDASELVVELTRRGQPMTLTITVK